MAAPPGSALRSRRRQSSTPAIDECVAEFIKRTVQKMSMAELMTILRAWGFLTERELQSLPTKTSKENIALEVLHLCEAKQATLNHAADLDIIYNHSNGKKRTWDVYQMTKPTDSEMNHIDVSEFKVRFKKAIHAVTKNVTIHFKDFGEAMWIRLAWGQTSMKPNQYKPTFVVYHTQTPYAFFTNLSRTFRPVLCQALLSAARYSQIQEMDLKSRCLDSLKDIVFKRFNQNLQAYHPRPLQERNYTPAIVDSRVTYENLKEKERVHHLTREAFGDGPLPKLEHASYRLETTFKGEQGIAEEIEPFRCVVKFSSPNLLESIRSLAPSGVAEAPISSLLTCIPHRARNLFKISEKKAIQPTSSQAAN
ncbi:PREDICTED: centromere protein N [Nanorana parkeri]|uniref:centromere protein N n=1 Tax=Nanorana parkeri TaxID=125878 RepID=UPI000854C922|nr:PREDICTED: centromere protein N [Nanorana parkeri]